MHLRYVYLTGYKFRGQHQQSAEGNWKKVWTVETVGAAAGVPGLLRCYFAFRASPWLNIARLKRLIVAAKDIESHGYAAKRALASAVSAEDFDKRWHSLRKNRELF